MEKKTAARLDSPTTFIVALDTDVGSFCYGFFDQGLMKVVAMRSVDQALARISEIMPVLVIIPAELEPGALARLRDHTSAVGAVLLALPRGASEATVRAELMSALGRVGR